jgi:hypothetical protein
MTSNDMIRSDVRLPTDEMDLEAVQRELAAYDPAAASAVEKSEEYMARRVQLWRRFDVLTRSRGFGTAHQSPSKTTSGP